MANVDGRGILPFLLLLWLSSFSEGRASSPVLPDYSELLSWSSLSSTRGIEGDSTGGEAAFLAAVEDAVKRVASPKCRNDSMVFLKHLGNFTLWAVQMMDASVKFPRGILSGNAYNMGDFDECLSVRGPHEIKGKYCLAQLDVKEDKEFKELRRKFSGEFDPYALNYDPLTSAWEKIEYKGDRSKHRRDQIFWAVCSPSSCTTDDVEGVMSLLIPPLARIYGAVVKISVEDKMCETQTTKSFSAGDCVYIAMVALVVTWSLSSTLYDCKWKRKDSKPGTLKSLFLCFSMKEKFLKLPTIASNADGLKVIFGVKVLSMMSVVLCHKYGVSYGGAATNVDSIEESNRVVLHMLSMHGDLVVDTFFALGAFLLAYATLKHLEAYGRAPIGVMIFFRYVRLTPAYAIVIFFYACILNKLGSGPLWNSTLALDAEVCLNNWWTNVLYISNYVKTNEMCMVQSWYLPCDTHFFIIGAVIMVLLHKRPRIGQISLALVTAASILVPFAVTLANHYDATVLFFRDFLFDPRAHSYFNNVYIKSHMRAGPYFAGIIGGYIYYRMRLFEDKMSRPWALFIFSLSLIITWIVMFSGAIFYIPNRPYYPIESAIYAGMQRFAWGAAICMMVVALASGKVWLISKFLEWSPFVVLGKLTYCAYLVHFVFQLFSLAGDRNPKYITNYYMFLMAAGELAFIFFSALLLYLMVEAPFRDIAKLIILRGKEPPSGKENSKEGARNNNLKDSNT